MSEVKGRWLLTFNDMMTLLFAFFVLIVSMSHLETAKVKGVAAAVRKVLGADLLPKQAKINVIEPVVPTLRDADIERAKLQDQGRNISRDLEPRRKALYRSLLQWEGVMILPRSDGFTLIMSEPLLFVAGAADLSGQGYQLLKSLAALLRKEEVDICVEGHTDNLPVSGGKFPSNWELSTTRAVNVLKYITDQGGVAPVKLSASGYAHTKPKWLNLDARNRRINSRTEIVLKYREAER